MRAFVGASVLTTVAFLVAACMFVWGIYFQVTVPPELHPSTKPTCHAVDSVWHNTTEQLLTNLRQRIYSSIFVIDPENSKNNGVYCWKTGRWQRRDLQFLEGQLLYERSNRRGWMIVQVHPTLQVVRLLDTWFVPQPHSEVSDGFASIYLGEDKPILDSWNVSNESAWKKIVKKL